MRLAAAIAVSRSVRDASLAHVRFEGHGDIIGRLLDHHVEREAEFAAVCDLMHAPVEFKDY
jgi:hypothetical protein